MISAFIIALFLRVKLHSFIKQRTTDMDCSPEQIKEWVPYVLGLGIPGFVTFLAMYFKDGTNSIIKAIASWITKK